MKKNELFFKKRDYRAETLNKSGSLPPEKRKKIVKRVTIIHFSIILIPLLWYAVSYFFIPKKSVIKVTLVSAPPAYNTQPVDKVEKATYQPPAKEKSVPPPPPRHKKSPIKHSSVKKVTKQLPKPIKQQPKWKPKTLKDITISKKVVKNSSPVPTKTVTHKVSVNDIESKLRKVYSSSNYKRRTVNTSRGNMSAGYRDKLYAEIYRLWDQPAKSELEGKYPIVDITITVESNGRVSSSRITQKSGINAMDASVVRLLHNLRQLPPPSAGRMTFTISLEIVN